MNVPAFLSAVPVRRALPVICMLSAGGLNAQQRAPRLKVAEVPPHTVVPSKELLITDPAVLQSPETQFPGPLSFGHLMQEMAGKEQASAFTLAWLELWMKDQTVNGNVAPARTKMEELVLAPWRERDAIARAELNEPEPLIWEPNLANAPFKLIAIVNRMDLIAPQIVAQFLSEREQTRLTLRFLSGDMLALAPVAGPSGFQPFGELFHIDTPEGRELAQPLLNIRKGTGALTLTPEQAKLPVFIPSPPPPDSGGSAGYRGGMTPGRQLAASGEGRLVFAVTGPSGRPPGNGFNVIFEYSLTTPATATTAGFAPTPPSGADNTSVWAARWHQLGTHAAFDAEYIKDLVQVTRAFTDSQGSEKRNFISQIRTNDGALDTIREFRQFHFVAAKDVLHPARLRQAPVSLTPADQFRDREKGKVLSMVLRKDKIRRGGPASFPISVRLTGQKEAVGLMGASALLPGNPMDFHWEVSDLRNKQMARNFSMQTCTGCHGGETRCDDGCHVKVDSDGNSTVLSAFLTKVKAGSTAPDGEMADRAAILKALFHPEDRLATMDLLRIMEKRNRRTH
jgi:hypothetical protein